MTAIEFYNITKVTLENMAKYQGIKDLDKYYTLTDFLAFPQLNKMGEIEQTYMQMAFHGQNATLISNIINFEKNYACLEKILCGFNPRIVLNKHFPQGRSRVAAEESLLNEFATNGIISNTGKSTKRPNAIMAGYVSMLLDSALYLSTFNSKSEVVEDLKKHYKGNDVKPLINYFRSKVKSRFSVALTCDFLKEYSEEFDLPKPDIHIKDTLCAYKRLADNYYHTEKREYECIKHMQELTSEINKELRSNGQKPITVYQLDRMIWIICSNKFFLDGKVKNNKEIYLLKIKQFSLFC